MKSLVTFLIGLALISCRQKDAAVADDKIMAVAVPEGSYADSTASAESDVVYAASMSAAPAAEPVEQKIIRDARLRFETSDMDKTYNQIIGAGKKYHAFIQNDTESKQYGEITRQLIVRIPNRHFDAFLADVGKDVNYFDQKEISTADVTEDYIDTEARLNAKKKLEARYLQLLGKAGKVSEMLEIEKQLAEVREEIEAKEGHLRYMKNRIAMSTVAIDFYRRAEIKGNTTVSFGTAIWNAIRTGFNSISAFFIEVLNNWPLILILVALIWWLRKKFRKRKNP